MTESVTEKAYAKINLGLKILGERSDGFHEILSVMQTIDLWDTLIFKNRTEGIKIDCSGEKGVPTAEDNLVYKAAFLLMKRFGIDRGAEIEIEKRIPVGAGLGGGSSDAAATLKGLTRLWGISVRRPELLPIAASIGSDVPFFLRKGTAIASGKGETLDYISPVGEASYVLVYPNFPVSTQWAYNNQKIPLTFESKYISFIDSLRTGTADAKLFYCGLENDLEEAVGAKYPVIGRIKEELLSLGAIAASLSGSGSTVYGIFDCLEEAQQAACAVQSGVRTVFLCRPVS